MQEEVENRTVNLAVTTTKLTARSVLAACMKYLRHRGLVKEKKAAEKAAKAKENAIPHGKQTVKELIRQDQGVFSNMDIAKTDLRVAKIRPEVRRGLRHPEGCVPAASRYIVFFQSERCGCTDCGL